MIEVWIVFISSLINLTIRKLIMNENQTTEMTVLLLMISQSINQEMNPNIFWWKTTFPPPLGTQRGLTELSPCMLKMIPCNRNDNVLPVHSQESLTWVRTTPNRNAPIVRKNPAKRRRALDLRATRLGSWVRVVCQRQTPGKMKMKTAARQPSRLITTPMLGISIANINEATNLQTETVKKVESNVYHQTVAMTTLLIFSFLSLSSDMKTSLMRSEAASLPQNKRIGYVV